MLCEIGGGEESDDDTDLPTASPDNRNYTEDPDTHHQPLSPSALPAASESGVPGRNVPSVLMAENSECRVLDGHSHLNSEGTAVCWTLPACGPHVLCPLGFPDGSVVKNPPANAGDKGSIRG